MTPRFLTTIATAFLLISTPALADSPQDAVKDVKNSHILDKRGGCVRTKWTAGDDACGAKPAPAPAPVVEKAPEPAPAPAQPSLEQRTVYFDFNKSLLTAESKATLDGLVEYIKGHEVLKATMVGYADKIGKDNYNVTLSQHRADAVKSYLGERVNIPVSSEVRGLGATNSVTECDTSLKRTERIACLAKDRRVEVEFTFQ